VGDGAVLLRRYVNRVNGSAVLVFLTVGRPGPVVSSHCPDSCYPGAGFDCVAPVAKRTIDVSGPQEFLTATFSKANRASPIHVRVFWAWSGTGQWSVPDRPRMTFAKYPRLYKLYVIRQLVRPTEPMDGDPITGFVQALVPELDRTLFRAE
jgi:hypothetical protein